MCMSFRVQCLSCKKYITNFEISTWKMKMLCFREKDTVRTKTVIQEAMMEQVAHFKYLGCDDCDIIYQLD